VPVDTISEEQASRLASGRPHQGVIAEVQAVFRAKRLRALDARYERSGPVGPLHRVRLLGKDNRETGELPASNGALVFARYQAARDAFPVARRGRPAR
jgi:Asp-tRNA(Asn)/Glu-tRNA(Gln) amidotransferase A subunit family amidase